MSTSHLPTHDVINQATAFEGQNLLSVDVALNASIARADAPWLSARAHQLGELVGSPSMQAWGRLANTHSPMLNTFDRFGHRLDVVEFHPAYHELMGAAMAHEIPSAAWNHERAGHLGFVALSYLFTQAEAGVICPMTMTYAAAPTLRLEPGLDPMWLEKLCHPAYDSRFIPASQKHALTFGMAMTEKQGGSDVRANTTTATPCDGAGRANAYLLRGHKWFCSAPMSDAFLTLAQARGGLSCFLVPRFRPDGTQNNLYIQRLKDKLGNKSNASAEIEYLDTWAQLVGEEGAGVRTIIEMVRHTRLACVAGSSGLMRHALTCAVHHARHRSAFGKPLYHQPLMRQVLADLTLESEAALHLATRMAAAFDAQEHNAHERALARIGVTLAKYWICKRTPRMTYEAMECLGGAGYVEESPMPRIFRESPLNSIWEGSGNVMALDILRAMHKEPECVNALRHEFARHAGRHVVLDELCASIDAELSNTQDLERRARRVAEQLALALQACAVAEQAPEFVFDAFVAARLGPERAHTFGALPASFPVDLLLARSLPE
jgi:putative acyl-CoA dehydrogenase